LTHAGRSFEAIYPIVVVGNTGLDRMAARLAVYAATQMRVNALRAASGERTQERLRQQRRTATYHQM
jgi:hypothetical protein